MTRYTRHIGDRTSEVTGKLAELVAALDAFRSDIGAAPGDFVVELSWRGGTVDGKLRTTLPLAVARGRGR